MKYQWFGHHVCFQQFLFHLCFFCFATLKYIISPSKDEDRRLQRTSSLCCLGCLVHSCSFVEASAAGIQTGHPTLLL